MMVNAQADARRLVERYTAGMLLNMPSASRRSAPATINNLTGLQRRN